MSAHKGMYKLWHVHSVELYNITAVKMYERVATYIILKGFHNHSVERQLQKDTYSMTSFM